MNIYTFLFTSFMIIIIPGTGVVYTISMGLLKGKKAGVIAAFGCTLGIIPHLFLSIMLSSLLRQMSGQAFFVLQSAGALYLFYLGIGMILSNTKFDLYRTMNMKNSSAIIIKAILINVLNPKLTLFFFSFLPQYMNAESQNYVKESMLLSIVFMSVTFFVFGAYGVLAGFVKTILWNSPKRIHRLQQLFGLIFIAFALKLISSGFLG